MTMVSLPLRVKALLRMSPLLTRLIPHWLIFCNAAGIYGFIKDFGVPTFTNSYWLTRIVFLRSIAFLYFVAFAVSYNQNVQLIGDNGLLPARLYLNWVIQQFGGGAWKAFWKHPTLLLFAKMDSNLDKWLNCFALCGLTLSAFVFVQGTSNMLIMFCLWTLYHSIVNVGQRWFSFGWESQLLEMGFLSIFLTPLLSLERFPKFLPTPFLCILGFRWLSYRIMLGAGMIKVRGDPCWLNLTCMDYHYETQPVPNFLSYYLHQSPPIVHKLETFGNHLVELLCPWLLLLPYRSMRISGGIIQILFQVVLIVSGNLSFLNWLTILPNFLCFDDQFLSFLFSRATVEQAKELRRQETARLRLFVNGFRNLQLPLNRSTMSPVLVLLSRTTIYMTFRFALHAVVGILLAYLSIPVIRNLMANHQIMNTSFDKYRLVNTYGAFGSVTRQRYEVIIRGSNHERPSDDRHWLEYEFKVKPGDVSRRPPWISPYHYRLDWLMWFAGFGTIHEHLWIIHLLYRLLLNDRKISSLLRHNPFISGDPPIWIRADLYEYKYTRIGSLAAQSGKWWTRQYVEKYVEPLRVTSPALVSIMRRMKWSAYDEAQTMRNSLGAAHQVVKGFSMFAEAAPPEMVESSDNRPRTMGPLDETFSSSEYSSSDMSDTSEESDEQIWNRSSERASNGIASDTSFREESSSDELSGDDPSN